MKRVEIGYNSVANELNKLNTQLEKAQKALAKKQAAAEKAGVAGWTDEEHSEWLKSIETSETGWILNKVDVKKNGAWFDLVMAQDRVDEILYKIEKAETRFQKAEAELEKHRKEVEAIEDLKEKERLQKLEFEQEQKEWAKDGITLEERYSGRTPQGKRFCIYRNSGYTERSWHCFTLYIDGETIFTSGEFWRAYGVIKNS